MPRTESGAWDRQPPARRDAERGAALVQWLDTEVRPFSPWWRERLRGIPVGGLDDLPSLPVLEHIEAVRAGGPGNPALLVLASEDGFKRHASRAEVAALARELGRGRNARRAALLRRYQPVHVHEAGAPPVAVAYTRTDLDRLHLAGARLAQVLGLSSGDGLVSVLPPGPSIRFWGLYHAALAARITAVHPRTGGEGAASAAARALDLLPATVLAVAVDEAAELLDDLAEGGRRLPTLRSLLTVGPPPAAAARSALAGAAERLAGRAVGVQAVWAPDSARALWGEPPNAPDAAADSPGLHTYPDLEVLEVRSGAGLAARSGGPGELLYTSLGWRGTVGVRLATGARVSRLVDDEPCPLTGRTVPRVIVGALGL